MKHRTFPFLLLLLTTACSKPADPGGAPPTPSGGGEPMGAHGKEQPLGPLTVGAHTFEVVQEGDVVAGKEAFFDLHLAKDQPAPAVVRGWLGVESGEGSMKARFGKEGDHGLHAHIDTPKVLPAGSKLWIEVEHDGKTTRGAIAWK
jgi:hypothetical protein